MHSNKNARASHDFQSSGQQLTDRRSRERHGDAELPGIERGLVDLHFHLSIRSTSRNSRLFFVLEAGQTEASNKACKLHEVSHTSAPQPFAGRGHWPLQRHDLGAKVAAGFELCNTQPSFELERSAGFISRLCGSI